MKKIIYFILLCLSFFLISCNDKEETNNNKETENPVSITKSEEPSTNKTETNVADIDYENIIANALDLIKIPSVINNDIELLEEISYDKYTIKLYWVGSNHLSNTGEILQDYEEYHEVIKVMGELEGKRVVKEFNVTIEALDIVNKISEYVNSITLPEVIKEDLHLFDDFELKDALIEYSCDSLSIDANGHFIPTSSSDDYVKEIKVIITYNSNKYEYSLGTAIIPSMEYLCNEAFDNVNIPDRITNDLDLPIKYGLVTIEWKSSNTRILTNNGELKYVSSETSIKLTSCYYIENEYGDYFLDYNYFIKAAPWDFNRRCDLVFDSIYVPSEAKFDIYLVSELDYDILCKWQSSDEGLLTNYGHVINDQENDKEVILTLTLYCLDSSDTFTKEYSILIYHLEESDMEAAFYNHNLIDRVSEYVSSNLSGLVVENGKAKLASGALVGTYDSKVFTTLDFRRVVGSFSCITSTDATCELAISIRVNDTWSKYFSYGEFGIGRNNLYYNQNDTLSYMDTDMIEPNSGLSGNGVKYRVTLRRTSATANSPELSMVTLALFLNNYTYSVDTSNLPNAADWDVPRLYQNDVPKIGSVICSATTTTMLLKFAGFDFSDKGYTYEHEYMANIVADRGHNNPTYGNWSYNMMAAGGYGVNAYVGTMYSWDEIRYHLANVGPIGCSIAGNFGLYSTNGHLIVVRGYRVENGSTTVICNDPNVKGTYYEVTLQTFLNCWRGVVYVIEYDKL